MKHFFALSLILLAFTSWIYTEADAQGTDTTRPKVTQIFVPVTNRPLNTEFTVIITFSEVVTGFERSDLGLTGTAVATTTHWRPQPNGTQYHATITPTGDGALTLNIAENVAFDATNNGNEAASRTVQIDRTPPTVTILPVIEDNHRNFFPNYYTDERIRAKGLIYNGDEFKVRIVFSEVLQFSNSFAQSELRVIGTAGAMITGWAATGSAEYSEYTATILPTSDGILTFSVPANVVKDKALNANKNPAKKVIVRIDTKPPVASISAPSGTQNGPFNVRVTFDEPVTVAERFLTPDSNGRTHFIWYADGYEGGTTTEKWTVDTNRRVYKTTFTPDRDRVRALKLYVVADRAFDFAGNTTVENRAQPTVVKIDTTPPRIVNADLLPDPPPDGFKVQFTFSEPVLGVKQLGILGPEGTDVTITNFESLPGGKDYVVTITDVMTPQLGLRIEAGAALDAANNANKPATIIVTIGDGGDDSHTITVTIDEPRPVLHPTPVAQDSVIFNEIRNAEDNKNDWLELKNISNEAVSLKDWEISIVNSSGQNANEDVDVVTFPNYTLPPGGILLITNTDSSETDLISGQNIENPNSKRDVPPQYLIAPEMKLPRTPYLLILRSATDKNGTPEAFEDLVGNYFRISANYGTYVWPLQNTLRPSGGTAARLTQGQTWRRIDIKKRGYLAEAWTLSGYQSGIGYKAGNSIETSLGTPGYPNDAVADDNLAGRITFSELMFATSGGLFSQPQWIELYNNTAIAAIPVNLKGWKLVVEARDSEVRHRHSVIELEALHIAPNRGVLLVTRNRRHSEYLSEDQIYDLYRHHSGAHRLGLRENAVLSASGFALKLFSPDGTLVDRVGNLDGEKGVDTPTWTLPSGRTEDGARTSLTRRYRDGIALTGTEAANWERAVDVHLPVSGYYGHKTDISTPGYRSGGPAPVMLSHFSANRTRAGVLLEWVTQSELDNAGFNILRSQARQGPFVKVNATLISGAGTTAERHIYTWTDTTTKPNVVYYYRIEDVSLSGNRQQLATARLRGYVSAAEKRLLKWADIKARESSGL